MIETTHLQTLVALVRSGSFSRAASELGVTQSAISQNVRSLENKVGVKIFIRSGKQVSLTSDGEKLHRFAQSFLVQLDKTIEQIHHSKDAMAGKVRIGTLPGVGKSWLTSELLNYAALNSELSITLNLGFEADLIRDFEALKLDMLILPADFLPTIGETVLLGEEKITLVFPKSPKFDIHPDIKLAELMKYPAIMFEEGSPLFSRWCKEYFKEVPKKFNIRYSINSHGNMLQAVIRELGMAVIPTHVLKRSAYRDKVQTLGPAAEVSNGEFYLIYHKELSDLLRIRSTIDYLTSRENPFSVGQN
ncbi:MAG: hypothetical protein A2504_08310 [Bdellovibrionales bacterium RIFOXYD12_FULL_39_22]|nr:MAG: hypothetical protein A2385_01535 [Bdellovibrionales bacterium RIFOXYB1_FULL_39_21]OFZ42873.1 MAG: hypothetical protein A2485_10835 [Bdellovibrionales bacterium RIFOXYC12_FULL_39_17]OFZ47467.1 MAG: hypothetical protein A2404_14455 [Bdellovibrionales bacterium RIFOXYC1_FULL_39_130]OFZ71617.1 MAG: hypothetical protein A2451_13235 [Bdellovibrionales bacterium RIFOXYC2_FULL_39_8]OFZ75555.1 MAG: hypothetical protein A2560_14605 [Bdellovibrionales bacterium RIFOXYD1_FULL_39_84]OFZ93878.1 MAG: